MRINFLASKTPKSQKSLAELKMVYKHHPLHMCDVVVVLGGDGFMIETIHNLLGKDIPIYGMNRGTVGFLLNTYRKNCLEKRIAEAVKVTLSPLIMKTKVMGGKTVIQHAINEVSLLRQTHQAANIEISLDNKTVVKNMVGDGVMVATPAGSTAYNASAHGPILPLGANVLALTTVSPFRPQRWHGAIIPDTSEVKFKIINPKKRPVSITADFQEVQNISEVTIKKDASTSCTLLFDPSHDLENRITDEQFPG